jgi:hypothetical protein
VQRAYRDRLKAAGKAVKLVDADFDTAEHRAFVATMRQDLHTALIKLEMRDREVARLTSRNTYLEGELIRLERELTNKAKDVIVARRAAKSKSTKPSI